MNIKETLKTLLSAVKNYTGKKIDEFMNSFVQVHEECRHAVPNSGIGEKIYFDITMSNEDVKSLLESVQTTNYICHSKLNDPHVELYAWFDYDGNINIFLSKNDSIITLYDYNQGGWNPGFNGVITDFVGLELLEDTNIHNEELIDLCWCENYNTKFTVNDSKSREYTLVTEENLPDGIPSLILLPEQVISEDPLSVSVTDEQLEIVKNNSFINLDITAILPLTKFGLVKFNQSGSSITFCSATSVEPITDYNGSYIIGVSIYINTNTKVASVEISDNNYLAYIEHAKSGDAIIYNEADDDWTTQSGYAYTSVENTGWYYKNLDFYNQMDLWGCANMTSNMLGIIPNESYQVSISGESTVTCTAVDIGNGEVFLGNMAVVGGPNTGEPFAYATKYSLSGYEFPDIWVYLNAGSTPSTAIITKSIYISGKFKVITPIDIRNLPNSNVMNSEGNFSVSEGFNTSANDFAHAEGYYTEAYGKGSHVEGLQTRSYSEYQHVQGKFNIIDEDDKYADIIGNGISGEVGERRNIETVDWNGNLWTASDIMAGGTDMDSPIHKLSEKITEPKVKSNGNFLKYNGTSWVAENVDALPAQSGQNGKFLTTNGTSASWSNVEALPEQTGQEGKVLMTNGTTSFWNSTITYEEVE